MANTFYNERHVVPALDTLEVRLDFRPDGIQFICTTILASEIRIVLTGMQGSGYVPLINQGPVILPGLAENQLITMRNLDTVERTVLVIAYLGYPTPLITTQTPDIDILEAMSILGSPNTYRQTGRTLYLTGFELDHNDWPWFSSDGNGGSIDVWTGGGLRGGQQPFRGSRCLRIHADTVAAAGEAWTSAIKLLPAMWEANIGLELQLAFGTNAQDFRMELGWDSDGDTRRATILIDPINNELSYLSSISPDVWTVFGTFLGEWRSSASASLRWGNCKLVVSDNQEEYLAFYLNNVVYPLTGFLVPTGTYPITAFERLAINLRVTDNDLTGGIAFVDDVLLTEHESAQL